MLEFKKAAEEIDRYLAMSQKGFKEGWSGFCGAEESYKKAIQVREQMLQSNLKEKGLAVCSHSHRWEGIEHPSAEQLGIYHRNQMRLHFYEMGPYNVQDEYGDSLGMTTWLRLCCPKHFPQNLKWTFKQESEFTHINSEFVQQDGKFILVVNGLDITKLVNKGGREVEPDGKRPYFIGPAVYRYFGIPDLPEKPDLDTIQHSR